MEQEKSIEESKGKEKGKKLVKLKLIGIAVGLILFISLVIYGYQYVEKINYAKGYEQGSLDTVIFTYKQGIVTYPLVSPNSTIDVTLIADWYLEQKLGLLPKNPP